MPGHVKKGGKQEQDPGIPPSCVPEKTVFVFCSLTFFFLDPSPWLILSFEMKKEDSLKPYGGILVGFSNFITNLSFQMQRNRSGSLMEKVALTRP